MAKYLMGIDAGNTSTKAVIFDLEGSYITSASKSAKEFPRSAPGFEEFDVDQQWDNCVACIRAVLTNGNIRGEDIVGIGITSFGNGLTFLGKNGENIGPCAFSIDSRSADVVREYYRTGAADKIREIIKCDIMSCSPGPILRWFKENRRDVYDKIGYVLLFKDFLAFRLTGQNTGDVNNIGGSWLLNMETFEYSKELMDLYGIPEMYDKLPKIAYSSSDTIGTITAEAAELTGLKEGTPVAACMMDMLACQLGAGGIEPHVYTAIAGTWSCNVALTDQIYIKPTICNMPYMVKGKYQMSNNTASSASNYEWFANTLGDRAKDEAIRRGHGVSKFDVLNEMIASVGVGGTTVFYHPFLSLPSVHDAAKGNFFNLHTGTRYEELVYAVAEGVAFIHRYHFEKMAEAEGTPPLKCRLTGGITRSDEWSQLFADALNLTVECAECTEAGALGCAMCAGIAAGVYADYDDACEKVVKLRPPFHPIPEHVEILNKRYAEWKDLIQTMQYYWDNKLNGKYD